MTYAEMTAVKALVGDTEAGRLALADWALDRMSRETKTDTETNGDDNQ